MPVESVSFKRLRRSAWAFSNALRIGQLAVLAFVFVLLASRLTTVPVVYWKICLVICGLGLGMLVLGSAMLAWNSSGYGFSGSHIHAYLFWLLILCGSVSAAFGFTARNRFIALVAFATGTVACVLLTPLLHYRLFRSLRRGLLGDKP